MKWPMAIRMPPRRTVRRSPSSRSATRPPRIGAEYLRGERLDLEWSEQEFEGGAHGAKAHHRFHPPRLEQILDHIENNQRGVAEIGESLPSLGCEEDGKPARMSKKVAAS